MDRIDEHPVSSSEASTRQRRAGRSGAVASSPLRSSPAISELVDECSEDSFPGSDPPSYTGATASPSTHMVREGTERKHQHLGGGVNRTVKSHLLERLAVGAAAGCAATVPMTAVLLAGERALPEPVPHLHEPQAITDQSLATVGLDDLLSARQRRIAAYVSHFAYGAAAGALGMMVQAPGDDRSNGILRGMSHGGWVWAASYAGWLPLVGFLPPPTRRPLRRNLLLIAAHLVWGAAWGVVVRRRMPTRRPRRLGRGATGKVRSGAAAERLGQSSGAGRHV